jgi:hypothetical protein
MTNRVPQILGKTFCIFMLFCYLIAPTEAGQVKDGRLTSTVADGGNSAAESSYSVLIKERAVRTGRDTADEVAEVIEIIGANGRLSATDLAKRVKDEMPEIDSNAPVKVLDEVLANIVRGDDDEQRMRDVLQPVLNFLGLEDRVRAVLFRSEVPVVALSPPNGLMISTRALAILNDEELRAIVTHELCHLPLTDVFRTAVDAKDYRTMRVIELFCDASAVAVMFARGVDPRLLTSGLRRMQQVLEVEFGERDLKGTHPTLDERERLVKKLSRRLLP